ncbi:MAG TPA: hypothetical protein VFS40_14245 [Gemmatimonadales bacterium]|nr:hypothetical protein [Gemmatimonadales bacterium]
MGTPIPPVPRPPRRGSPSLSARLVHGAIVAGVLVFFILAGVVGERAGRPAWAVPERKVLYLLLFAVTVGMFAAATFFAGRLPPRGAEPEDVWWRRALPRVVLVWALVEGPTLLGVVAYLLTRDFRTLIATLAGLVLFFHFSPGRLVGRP